MDLSLLVKPRGAGQAGMCGGGVSRKGAIFLVGHGNEILHRVFVLLAVNDRFLMFETSCWCPRRRRLHCEKAFTGSPGPDNS